MLLLLVENYTQYPALLVWNITDWGNFWRPQLEPLKVQYLINIDYDTHYDWLNPHKKSVIGGQIILSSSCQIENQREIEWP